MIAVVVTAVIVVIIAIVLAMTVSVRPSYARHSHADGKQY
jgi:hypothetical protein